MMIRPFASGLVLLLSPCIGCSGQLESSGDPRVSQSHPSALSTPPPGTLDTTFGKGGVAIAPVGLQGPVFAAVQSDGAIVAAATVTDAATGGSVVGVVRFTANGAVDSTFGHAGVVQTAFGVDSVSVGAVAIAPSGKVVVALTDSPASAPGAMAVAQYTASGALDATFGNGGVVDVPVTGVADGAKLLLIQPDGEILLAGTANLGGGKVQGVKFDGMLVRLTTTGALDATFGHDGVVTSSNGQPQPDTFRFPTAMALDSAGDIFVLDTSQSTPTIAEFSPSGVAQTTVSLSGSFASVSAADFGLVAFQLDGRYVVAGGAQGETRKTGLVKVSRFLLNGTPDSSFSSPAFSFAPQVVNTSSVGQALLVESSGNIVVGGIAPFLGDGASGDDFGVAELVPSGPLNGAFGKAGTVVTNITGRDEVTALVQQASGNIVALGETNSGIGATRYIGP